MVRALKNSIKLRLNNIVPLPVRQERFIVQQQREMYTNDNNLCILYIERYK
jgi:hypothetical protein